MSASETSVPNPVSHLLITKPFVSEGMANDLEFPVGTAMNGWQIGIVGGGPGGLMVSYFLQKWLNSPHHITLFEASGRLGGKILTPRFETLQATYEAGAAEIYDYSHLDEDPLKELIEELGLPIHRMDGSSAIVRNRCVANLDDLRDQLGPEAVTTMMAFDRYAKDQVTPREFWNPNSEYYPDPLIRPGFETELAQQIRMPCVRRYVEQFIHSDLATEPAKTSVAYGLHNYLMNDGAYMSLYGIAGGNEALPRELAKRIQADVRFQHRVSQVERLDNGKMAVTTHCQAEVSRSEFDFVILALPHNALTGITFIGKQLARAMSHHIAEYNFPAHYLRVTIAFKENFWQGRISGSYCMLDSFGGCCLYDESSRDPGARTPVLGWLIAGDAAESLSTLSNDELIARALGALPDFLARGRELALEGRVHRWLDSVNGLPGGLHPRTLDLRHRPEPLEHPRLFVVGDYLFDSTLNGVLDSASYVASWMGSILTEDSGGTE